MVTSESELHGRLLGDDDDEMEAALRERFEPRPEPTPFLSRWYPRTVGSDEPSAEPDGVGAELRERLLRWANDAQRARRLRRFRRRHAAHPEWPVVVCEGDSWVAHPMITDITDHLLDDDRHPLSALGVGAAADLLRNMEAVHDHERAAQQHGAAAIVLSGGGNDLMLAFPGFLRPWRPGTDPTRLFTPAVDEHMRALSETMTRLLVSARKRLPRLPIVVHGYDYLRVVGYREEGKLGRLLDHAGVRSLDERRALLRAIVDGYNVRLRELVRAVEGVAYVDLRGVVDDDAEWHDEIHPSGAGFGRMTDRIAQVLLERIADAG